MDYLFSFILIAFNLFDYEFGLNRILFLAISCVIFAAMIFCIHRKTKDILCTLVTAMCHTWPISWVNIFGDDSQGLQITWYYLLGAAVLLYGLFNINKFKENKVNALILGAYTALSVIFI